MSYIRQGRSRDIRSWQNVPLLSHKNGSEVIVTLYILALRAFSAYIHVVVVMVTLCKLAKIVTNSVQSQCGTEPHVGKQC